MQQWATKTADALEAIRSRHPRVHCITNEVAVTYSANALLALGAVPSMTWQPAEVADFVTSADALVINLGTLDPQRFEGMQRAIEAAGENGIPFVLDPVFVERSDVRLQRAAELIALGPTVIRGNATEFACLREYCRDSEGFANAVHVQSGATDDVTFGGEHVSIQNGDAMMAQVTATGCAATALLGACITVCDSALEASVAAMTILGVAGECAVRQSAGPGSLQFALLDALANIDGQTIVREAQIS